MILSALNDYYQRLAEEHAVPVFGFSQEKISYALVLSVSVQPPHPCSVCGAEG